MEVVTDSIEIAKLFDKDQKEVDKLAEELKLKRQRHQAMFDIEHLFKDDQFWLLDDVVRTLQHKGRLK